MCVCVCVFYVPFETHSAALLLLLLLLLHPCLFAPACTPAWPHSTRRNSNDNRHHHLSTHRLASIAGWMMIPRSGKHIRASSRRLPARPSSVSSRTWTWLRLRSGFIESGLLHICRYPAGRTRRTRGWLECRRDCLRSHREDAGVKLCQPTAFDLDDQALELGENGLVAWNPPNGVDDDDDDDEDEGVHFESDIGDVVSRSSQHTAS